MLFCCFEHIFYENWCQERCILTNRMISKKILFRCNKNHIVYTGCPKKVPIELLKLFLKNILNEFYPHMLTISLHFLLKCITVLVKIQKTHENNLSTNVNI